MTSPDCEPYDAESYATLPTTDLVLFGIYLVTLRDETCTFERLVAECFRRFPAVFAFKRYPRWPDSLKLDRPLRTLRQKGFIVGSVRDAFALTTFGEYRALEVEKTLQRGGRLHDEITRDLSGRSAHDRLIAYLKASPLVQLFLASPTDCPITEPEFRGLLRCTLETPLRVVKQNLEYYKNVAELYGETEIRSFLSMCEQRFMRGRETNG